MRGDCDEPTGAASAPAVVLSGMLVAIVAIHWNNGLLALSNGVELPVLHIAAALLVALSGPGMYSLDAAMGLTEWWTPEVTARILALGVMSGAGSLAMRRSAPAAAHA